MKEGRKGEERREKLGEKRVKGKRGEGREERRTPSI